MKKTSEKSIQGTVLLTAFLLVFPLFLWLFLSGNGMPSEHQRKGLREFRNVFHSAALPEQSGRRIRNANRLFNPAARQNRSSEDRPDAVPVLCENMFPLPRLSTPGYFLFTRIHASAGILVSHPARASPEIC